MGIQVLQLVVPSLLTVIGWLIAAWWALEQVRLAHENNAKLQRELLSEAYRRDVARELVEVYKSITQSANSFRQAVSSFFLNYTLEKSGGIEGVTINATRLVAPINDTYNRLAQEISRLDMWLKVSGEHVGDTSLLRESIVDFHSNFSITGNVEEPKAGVWAIYQGLLAAYQSNIIISDEKLNIRTREITTSLDALVKKLADGTANLNRQLCEV